MSEIKNKAEIFEAIKTIAKQNLLTIPELKDILEKAIFKSFRSKFDPDAELELTIDEIHEKFELVNKTKVIVEDDEYEPENHPFEIPLSVAKKLDPHAEAYQMMAQSVDFATYSKMIANSIKAMVTQSVKERKKEAVWEKHQSLKGEMIDVVVANISPMGVVCALDDNTTAYMPQKFRNAKIPLKIGQRIKVYVEDVLKDSKESQIIVSNGSKILVKRVLENEVPEIASGVVEIVSISRIPGERSKVVVRSTNSQIDPVGAVIGTEGSRIVAINEKLEGEKLDVIAWSSDVNKFIANAFAPARIVAIVEKRYAAGLQVGQVIPGHIIAVAPDRHQTLAIGKNGLNARLVVELANVRIDVISLTEAMAQGLEFTWNGNISPEEVERLESGEKIRGAKPTFRSVRQDRPSLGGNFSAIAPNSFDADIASFNVEIEDNPTSQQKDFELDDSLFSEDELRAMEASFELGDDLPLSTNETKASGDAFDNDEDE